MLEAFKVRKPWAAALVAFVDPFIGMLYLGRGAIAFLYFGVELAAFLVIMYMLPNGLFGPSPQVVLGIVFLPIRLTGTVHAFVLAQRRTLGMPQQWYARWYVIVLTAFVIPVLGGSLRTYFFEPFHLAGASMAPTLNTADNVGASKSAYDSADPKRGDVILLYVPSGKRFVRRIIGMPGDHIQVKDGVLFLNDTAVRMQRVNDHEYIETLPEGKSYHIFDIVAAGLGNSRSIYAVPPGYYFVLSDNRIGPYSVLTPSDFVARGYIIGKVKLKYYDSAKHRFVLESVQ